MAGTRRCRIVLIKASRYDDDGYVIQWRRSAVPSNSLGCVYALANDCAERRVLGPDVDIEAVAYDETNTVIPVERIVAEMQAADGGFVGLVGVQSNQFPRATDLARQVRAHGIPVVIGGFHVSGCLAMLPEVPADIQAVIDMGCSIFAGEAEGRFEGLLRDIWAGAAKPVYNYMAELPDLAEAPTPSVPDYLVERVTGRYTTMDCGRGCPYQCSFCSIINVQGRKSRWRSPDAVEALVRDNVARGFRRFLITDDNFSRNKDWELILDRLIALREGEGLDFKFFIQVDALCHRTPGFIEKAARAGCHWVYIGLENINPENLMAAKKRQNKIWEYRQMLQEWKRHGVMTYVGYITGFPHDTPESIARDVEIIKEELPLELIEFFFLTPLPGSEDHQRMWREGAWMDPDMNKYALSHRVTHHPKMSDAEWERAYREAWEGYYAFDHMERILRRAAVFGKPLEKMVWPLLWFHASHAVEKVHPVEGGYLRIKVRTQRRHGMPLESPAVFYPRRAWELASGVGRWLWIYWRLRRMAKRIEADPNKRDYVDRALLPVSDAEEAGGSEMLKVHGQAANTLQRAHIKVGESPEPAEERERAAAE